MEVNNKLLESKFSKSLARKYIQMENRKEARKWFDIQSSLILDEDERGKFDMYYNKSGVLMMEEMWFPLCIIWIAREDRPRRIIWVETDRRDIDGKKVRFCTIPSVTKRQLRNTGEDMT